MHHFLRPAPAALLSATLALVLLLPGCTRKHIESGPPGARTPVEVHGQSGQTASRVQIVQSHPQPVPLTSARGEEEIVVSGKALPKAQTAAPLEEESLSGHPMPSAAPNESAGARQPAALAAPQTAAPSTPKAAPPMPDMAATATMPSMPESASAAPTTAPNAVTAEKAARQSAAAPNGPAVAPATTPATTPETTPTPSDAATEPVRTVEVAPTSKTMATSTPTTPVYNAAGMASWISTDLQGEPTASGELYDVKSMTASHRTLPMGTRLEVTNLENGKSVVVRINDRGPFVKERLVDVSYAAAQKLDLLKKGIAKVGIRVLPAGTARMNETPTAQSSTKAEPQGANSAETSAPATSEQSPTETASALAEERPDAASETPTPEQPAAALAPEAAPSAQASPAPEAASQPAAPRKPASAAGPSTNAKTPAPVAAKAATDGAYFIQVGTFSRQENAQRLLDQLRSQGYPGSRVVETSRDGKPLYRVQAGAFHEQDEAMAARATFRETFPSSFLIRD